MRILVFIIITLTLFNPLKSAIIECEFNNGGDWWVVKNLYYCDTENSLNIKSNVTAFIHNVTGTHALGFNIDSVKGFHADNKTIQFFPRDLAKFFKNLEMIDINKGRLKEIHQTDLQDFPNLKCLDLNDNDIEVLEDELFNHNSKLEMVWLSSNKIFHISVSAFSAVMKLRYVSFVSNPCANKYVKDNETVAVEIVKEAVENCVDLNLLKGKFPSLMKTIETLEKTITEIDDKVDGIVERGYDRSFPMIAESSRNSSAFKFFITGLMIVFCVSIVILWRKIEASRPKVEATIAFENPEYN